MSRDESPGLALELTLRIWVDAMAYAVTLAAVVTLAALVVGIATTGSIVQAKVLAFVAGWLLLVYATVRLWPTSPEDATGEEPSGRREAIRAPASETRFQRFVQALPPLRWMRLPPPEKRISAPSKLFLGSLFVLVASYLMEAVFNVA